MRYYQRTGVGPGLTPESQKGIVMFNRTGSTISPGAVLQVDIYKTDADSTTMTPGAAGSAYRNLITPVTLVPLRTAEFMCYEGPGTLANDAEGKFTLVGLVDVDIVDGAVALVDVLAIAASTELAINPTLAGQKIVARAQATRASGGALVPCFFNGYGFVQDAIT